jgi:hypothetical protein
MRKTRSAKFLLLTTVALYLSDTYDRVVFLKSSRFRVQRFRA